jgi:mannonate dehydratase
MEQCWRWFGPRDPVTLAHVRQAGATGVVSALHETYRGEVWDEGAIAARRAEIEAAGLRWSVVESIPVPNAIKLGGEAAREATAAFAETLRRVARAGVATVCYNFMPVLDWTRTALRHPCRRAASRCASIATTSRPTTCSCWDGRTPSATTTRKPSPAPRRAAPP